MEPGRTRGLINAASSIVALGGTIGIFGEVLLVCAVYEEFCRSPLVLAAEFENLGCVAIVWAEGIARISYLNTVVFDVLNSYEVFVI